MSDRVMSSYTGGNYGSVGQQINKQNQTINRINMESSPNYGEIAEEAIKGRSKERRAAIQAEAAVHKTGLAEMSKNKQYQIKADSDKEVANIKKPAKRFAGIVGAAGTIAGAAMMNKFNNESDARAEKLEQQRAARHEQVMAALNKPTVKPDPVAPPPKLTLPDLIPPGGTVPSSQQVGDTSTGKSSSTSGSGAQGATTLSQQEIAAKFKARGFDDATSHLWSAIAMQESSGRAGAHNDGTSTNSVENSHGILQINTNAHMDKLTRRGWSVSDLQDPDKNIDIAIEVFNEVGGKFTPWGGYTDGGYKKFL